MNQQNPLPLIGDKPSSTAGYYYPAISLFSGAGGLDLGLKSASGGKINFQAWVENNEDCQETLIKNGLAAPSKLFGDIRSISARDISRAAGIEKADPFLIAGGPPCQDFSTAGLRRSIHESRGQTVGQYFDLIKAFKPRFFVFENVRGLLSVAIKHRPYAERIMNEKKDPGEPNISDEERLGSVFQKIVLPALERLGYEVVYGLVNTADYGAPQVRHRVVIFGSRDKEFGSGRFRKITGRPMTAYDLLPPTHHQFAPYPPISKWKTLKDAIGDERFRKPTVEQTFSYSEERKKIWRRIPPGHYWTYIRDNPHLFPEGLENVLGGAYNSGGGKVGFWRRLDWDKPAPTLPTQPQHLATGLCHPEEERPLSVAEYAALQEFPESYAIAGDKASQYEQLGNAVPTSLGSAIGNLLLAVANKTDSASKSVSDFDRDERNKLGARVAAE